MKALALVLAIVFFILAILYWIGKVQLFASHGGPHHLHAILFFVLGILSLLWMRFQSGTPSTASGR